MLLTLILLVAAPEGALTIDHSPVDCVLANRFAVLEAAINPLPDANSARVHFRSGDAKEFSQVDMLKKTGRFSARLPRPKLRAETVSYFIVATAGGREVRTPVTLARVVKEARQCAKEDALAEVADGADVDVFVASASAKPEAFEGIRKVTVREERARPAAANAPAEPEAFRAAAAGAGVQDYAIGPEDILKITVTGGVTGSSDEVQTVVVQGDGTFSFPLLGRVAARERTPKELEQLIGSQLHERGFIRNPRVDVKVEEYRSQTVSIVGEVDKPGKYPLTGNRSLMEVVSKAGPKGLAIEAQIVRPRTGSEGAGAVKSSRAEVIRVSLAEYLHGDLSQNVVLQPGDAVFVELAKISVSGEVRNPGLIPYRPGATVRQVISAAGGFTADASTGRVRIYRMVGGEKRPVKVKLEEPVQPSDEVEVGAKLF